MLNENYSIKMFYDSNSMIYMCGMFTCVNHRLKTLKHTILYINQGLGLQMTCTFNYHCTFFCIFQSA